MVMRSFLRRVKRALMRNISRCSAHGVVNSLLTLSSIPPAGNSAGCAIVVQSALQLSQCADVNLLYLLLLNKLASLLQDADTAMAGFAPVQATAPAAEELMLLCESSPDR